MCSLFTCVGRAHGKSYALFRVGQKASPGMKVFAETGKTDELNDEGGGGGGGGQGENDVYDVFGAPAIPTGTGRTETQFIVDGNHSLVRTILLYFCVHGREKLCAGGRKECVLFSRNDIEGNFPHSLR